jgi:membrane protein
LLKAIAIFRAAGARFSLDTCAILAQAIAFNAVFAIFPLTILAIATLAFVYGNVDEEQRAFALILQLAPELQDLLTENLRNVVTFRGLSGAISLIGLIWTGKNLFQALAFALDRALGVPRPRQLIPNIATALVMLPLLGVLLLAASAVPIVVSVIAHFGPLSGWTLLPQVETYGFSLLVVFAASALLYRYLPYRAMAWRFVLPGAAFSALTFNLAQIAFAIYTTHTNFSHVYGAVAAIAVTLLWFYFVAALFLYGAELAVELEASATRAGQAHSSVGC